MPIMFPANKPITFPDGVFVRFEIARPKLKFNSYSLFCTANFLVTDAIGELRVNFFYMHLKFSCDVSKQIYNAKFIFRRVMQRRIVKNFSAMFFNFHSSNNACANYFASNGCRSSVCSPRPMNLIGRPGSFWMATTMPPLLVPLAPTMDTSG